MKRFIYLFLLFIFIQNLLNAHSVVLKTIDNEDGTMEIFGGFSTGVSAIGAKLIIKSQIDSNIIYQNRIPKSGTLIIQIPKEPYKIILDSGPGHRLEKVGDITPIKGFNQNKTKPISFAFIVTLSISIFFILMGIFLSFKELKSKNLKSF